MVSSQVSQAELFWDPLVVSLGLLRWQEAEQGGRGGLGARQLMLARVHGHSLEGGEKKG